MIEPGATDLADEFPLSEVQIAGYHQKGFIALENIFSGNTLRDLRRAVAGAVERERDANLMGAPAERPQTRGAYEQLFIQRVNLWSRHGDVAPFVLSRRLASIAAQLEGTPMRLWHDQALFKEPGLGNNKTPWHQDAVYWPHRERRQQTTIWIALTDATIVNGCMSFIPGSHRVGPLPKIDLANPEDLFHHARQFQAGRPTTIELKAGSATFHNGLTFHFAGPNKSSAMREAFAIIYMPDGTTFDGQRHPVTDPLGLQPGEILGGEMFPRLS